jgi:hypothetical protein
MKSLELCDLEAYRDEAAECLAGDAAAVPRAEVRTLVDAFDDLLRRYRLALTQNVELADKLETLEATAREVVAWHATRKRFSFEVDALRILVDRSR